MLDLLGCAGNAKKSATAELQAPGSLFPDAVPSIAVQPAPHCLPEVKPTAARYAQAFSPPTVFFMRPCEPLTVQMLSATCQRN
jgi:hypothetical protein